MDAVLVVGCLLMLHSHLLIHQLFGQQLTCNVIYSNNGRFLDKKKSLLHGWTECISVTENQSRPLQEIQHDKKKKKRESGKAESRKDPSDSSHNNVFIVKTAWVDLLPVSNTPRNTPGNKQRNKMKIIELVPTFATKNSNRWRLREWRH